MTEQKDRSEPFVKMAAAITLNASGRFGGAVVIIPPDGAGENIEVLMIDSDNSPAQFWATIETKAIIRKNEAIETGNSRVQFPRGR